MLAQSRYAAAYPRTPKGGQAARRFVVAIAAQWLSGVRLADLELAAGEAIANAVEYGEGFAVNVACWCERTRVVVEVHDRGNRFARAGPPMPPPKGAARGYGLFIMHQAMDEVEFMEGETRLRLAKRLPTAPQTQSANPQAGSRSFVLR